MTAFIIGISVVLLTAAAVLTLYRLAKGPTTLDRIVAADVILALFIAAIGVYSVAARAATAVPILLVLSLLGFSSAVSVARLISPNDVVRQRFDRRRADREAER